MTYYSHDSISETCFSFSMDIHGEFPFERSYAFLNIYMVSKKNSPVHVIPTCAESREGYAVFPYISARDSFHDLMVKTTTLDE
jgi:hypothetical protein